MPTTTSRQSSGASRVGVVLPTVVLAFCVVVAMMAGCSNDAPYERVYVSGNVTFQGQPVEDGQISFTAKRGTTAPAVIEHITDGHYATTASGGVPVGQYRVEIRSYDPNVPFPAGPEDPPRPQLLPAKYNTMTKLEFAVEAGQDKITRNFELTE